ncbi:hypothetical protein BH09ACT10_BH09ACT10_26270 [soil metagenome]
MTASILTVESFRLYDTASTGSIYYERDSELAANIAKGGAGARPGADHEGGATILIELEVDGNPMTVVKLDADDRILDLDTAIFALTMIRDNLEQMEKNPVSSTFT